MSLLCRLGWHSWKKWEVCLLKKSVYNSAGGSVEEREEPGQERDCIECGKKEIRLFKIVRRVRI